MTRVNDSSALYVRSKSTSGAYTALRTNSSSSSTGGFDLAVREPNRAETTVLLRQGDTFIVLMGIAQAIYPAAQA